MSKRWKRRPEGSNWGEFGDDDQLGRLNYLTSEKVLQGIAEVKEGKTFFLGLPLDIPRETIFGGDRVAPRLFGNRIRGYDGILFNSPPRPGTTDVWCDDSVTLALQYSTQWDALCHMGNLFDADGDGELEPVFYNGYKAHVDIVGERDGQHVGALKLGIETFAERPIQSRGVMINLAAHVPGKGHAVPFSELETILRDDKITVERGDLVCFHTGYAEQLLAQDRDPGAKTVMTELGVLGHDKKLLEWVTDTGLSAMISDNWGVESGLGQASRPSDPQSPRAATPLHEHCLFKLGIPLGELWYLTPLANWLRAHKRSRFLLTAPALRLPRAVGSPVSPIATV